MKVLLVEDEKKLIGALKFLFEKNNINIDVAEDGEEGLIFAEKDIYDVIILDIMLPKISGLEILKNIRKRKNNTPILMLTAKDAVEDRVKGLDLGADDYLIKPFAIEELLARIRSLSRRQDKEFIGDTMEYQDVIYDGKNFILRTNNRIFDLTKKEGELMEMLIKRPGQVFTREQIIDRLWGLETDVSENNIEIYIHHLRKKLKSTRVEIKTVRGIGYSLGEK
ncbi:MAG: response regulator transcription factor [Bacillota bacterium]|nr:response regulator transcription factor [Bacillota bacterium]